MKLSSALLCLLGGSSLVAASMQDQGLEHIERMVASMARHTERVKARHLKVQGVECQQTTVTCKDLNQACDAEMVWNGASNMCSAPNNCRKSTSTCQAENVGATCTTDDDCVEGANKGHMDSLGCFPASGGGMTCQWEQDYAIPSGCRSWGDECTTDNDCWAGTCSDGLCKGLSAGDNCTGATDECPTGTFCNTTNATTAEMLCDTRWPDGSVAYNFSTSPPTPYSTSFTGGMEWRCRNMWVINGLCASVPWFASDVGGECHHEMLGDFSHYLCKPGLFCSNSTSKCATESLPTTCTSSMNGSSGECDAASGSFLNSGICMCSGVDGTMSCVSQASMAAGCNMQGFFEQFLSTQCGDEKSFGDGRCTSTDIMGSQENWKGSCRFKERKCVNERYMACGVSKQWDMVLKAYFPGQSQVCGNSPPKPSVSAECAASGLAPSLATLVVVGVLAMAGLA